MPTYNPEHLINRVTITGGFQETMVFEIKNEYGKKLELIRAFLDPFRGKKPFLSTI
jgi:hypothetical protein